MTSVVAICNLALSNIGKGTISDISEGSAEARQCRLHYDVCRNSLLQQFPWMFARKVQSLAALENDWPERWSYRYQRPSDCLTIIRLVPALDRADDTEPAPHGLRAGSVYADHSPAFLEFTREEADPIKYPPLFVDALAWALAARIAIPLTKDQSMRKDAYQLAISAQSAAAAADANSEPDRPSFHASWMVSR